MKVLITTVPFASVDKTPIELLDAAGIEWDINPLGRKLTENELAELIGDYDCLIAGTEQIGPKVFKKAKNLKHIARVGVGLDSVDLNEAKNSGVSVSYTPTAPAPAVAELTVCLMLCLARNVHNSNIEMHQGRWVRHFGSRLGACTVGIVGVGRIGGAVIEKLRGFDVPKIQYYDIDIKKKISGPNVRFCEFENLISTSDIISIHVPLSGENRGLIDQRVIASMKREALLVNTARGGVVDEEALYHALNDKVIRGAAIDVFEQEPYVGPLSQLDNCLLTSHMGSMSSDCRVEMEVEATNEVVRFKRGERCKSPVPHEEYHAQSIT